jgi:filamentous hemagglutinin family protein
LYKIFKVLACMLFFSSICINYSSTKQFYLKFIGCIVVSSLIYSYIYPAVSQIIPDTNLPINTTIRLDNNTSIIESGTRVQGNLFHSFREFSIINGSEALFNNPLDIRNIITRVTGQSPSDINGIIRANGSANLFLINPNGIIFGENARLDIGGSFVGSTANSLLFDNGWEYNATNPNSPPLLTVNVPVGLQFGRNPGAIEVRGSGHGLLYAPIGTTIQDNVPAMGVQTGKTLALVGGDIFIKGGNLNAESGKIFLGSVNSPDLVRLTINNTDLAFEYSGVEKFGNIELSQKASVDVSGEGGGFIQIQSQGFFIRDGSSVLSMTTGSQPGRDIVVNTTGLVELAGESADNNYYSSLFTESLSAGSSGSVAINTQRLIATGGAYVSTFIGSSGNGGDLTVIASQAIELSDERTFSSGLYTGSSDFSSGSAGNLNIKTGRLIVKNGATVYSSTAGEGSAGDLNIKTGELIAQDGGQILASTYAQGKGGNLTIDATSSVELIGIDTANSRFPSGLLAAQQTSGEIGIGNAGNLIINTPLLRVLDGAFVDAGTFGAGRGGELKITTDRLLVRNASIRVQSLGTGSAGNLTINANSINLDSDTLLTANTPSNGLDQATINITSADLIQSRGSQITTNATGSNVTGGNINIKTGNLALLERSDITANSTDARGGKINIQAQGYFKSPDSTITARGATQALSGIVNINSTLDPSSVLKEIPINLVDLGRQIASTCVPGIAQDVNTFTITGRGGIPVNSTELLHDASTIAAWVTKKPKPESEQLTTILLSQQSSVQPNSIPQPIVEATDWLVDNRGQIHLVATNQANYMLPQVNVCP